MKQTASVLLGLLAAAALFSPPARAVDPKDDDGGKVMSNEDIQRA